MERRWQAIAGGARPRRILTFESLSKQKGKQIPEWVSAFLVRRKGLEPPTY